MVFFQRPHLQSGASVLQALLVRNRSKNPEAEQGGQGRARVPLPLEHWEALGGQPRSRCALEEWPGWSVS